MEHTTIMSLNISVITAPHKLAALRTLIQQERADIVLLQEVSVHSFNFPGLDEIVNVGVAGRGTAILYKKGLPLHATCKLPSGRGISARLGDVTIVNIYAPAGTQGRRGRGEFFTKDITPLLQDAAQKIVLGGDFNCVLHAQDTTGVATPSTVLRNVVAALGLKDAWKELRPGEDGFTFTSTICSSRLDRIYVTAPLLAALRAVQLKAASCSPDHLALRLDLELGLQRRVQHRVQRPGQPGSWKLDPCVLASDKFLPRFKLAWESWRGKKKDFADVIQWWEWVKKQVKTICSALSKEVRKDDESFITFYTDVLNSLAPQRVGNPAVQQQMKDIKERINRRLQQRLLGLAARAKCPDLVGEQPSVHHVAATLKRRAANTISSLEGEDGRQVTEQDDLAALLHGHFQRVFAEPDSPLDATPLLDDVITPVISEDDNEALLQPITLEELLAAVKLCPRGKSPGEDGITAELYLVAFEVLGQDFLEVVNAMLLQRRVAPSHTKGIMVLLPKVGHPTTVKDLRPVTLLNTDGKIFSRILTHRLEPLQSRILDPMQVQPGSDRNMYGALVDLRDAIAMVELAKKKDKQAKAALVSVDFAGAFNNVRHDYMWAVLRRCGLTGEVIKILQSMYGDATTAIRVNGLLTEPVRLLRGVRQGCPVSMLLFNVVMAPLIKWLNKHLAGVRVPDIIRKGAVHRLAASAYVDDAVAILEQPEDITVLDTTLEQFGEESGLHVNPAKSSVLPLGAWSREVCVPFPYKDSIRILGVTFTASVSSMLAVNWTTRVGTLRATLVDAKLRVLDIQQRVSYANTYALSLIWHLSQVLPLPTATCRSIHKALNRFLWAGQFFQERLEILVLPPSRGGLGLHDPTRKARSLFVGRWLTALRATQPTLAGGWLPTLAALYGGGEPLPRAVSYFATMRDVLAAGGIPSSTGRELTRELYEALLLRHRPAPPRVQAALPDADWPTVWTRVASRVLPRDVRAAWYLVVHDIPATRSRTFGRCRVVTSALCGRCGLCDTLEHRLARCGPPTRAIWRWIARKVAILAGVDAKDVRPRVLMVPDLAAPTADRAVALTWVMGTAVKYLLHHRNTSAYAFARHMLTCKQAINNEQLKNVIGKYVK